MGKGDAGRCIFPLTSLQIGDLQSYLSDLSLFLALESKKFYILVDNRPWLGDLGSRSAHLWQLMVTKSRLSPFANTKARKVRTQGKDACSRPKTAKPKKFARWFSLIKSQKKVLLPVKKLRTSLLLGRELHRTLYGFIVFEVSWSNVRGINYLNELQTDTSLAIEAKFMQRWEFDSIAQAASCIYSWFSGTFSEQLQLKEYLNSAIGEVFYDAEEYPDEEEYPETIPVVEENILYNNLPVDENSLHCLSNNFSVHSETSENKASVAHTPPPPTGPYKRRKITTSFSTGVEVDTYSEEMQTPRTCISDCEDSETYACYYGDEMQKSESSSCYYEDEMQNLETYTCDSEDEMKNSKTSTCDTEDSIPVTVKTCTNDSEDSVKDTQFREDAIPVTVNTYTSDCLDAVEATQYRDVLILFRFNDCDLPFKLREIIMSDIRLLTLLEAGLPSWVIFLQSYPGFCHIYRPWMCPLARALYVLISVVTVLIGFYDLYKNVPVLKATASRLCGPLFDWIETWSMISRIKYLGTMLFLHNSQKAVQWFLTIRSTTRSFLSVLAQPLAEPLVECFGFLLPVWNVLIDILESLCSVIWILIGSSCSLVVQVLLFPIWFVLTAVWSIGTSIVYPIFWMLWEVLYTPVRMVLALSNGIAFICNCIYDTLRDIWQFVSSIFQFASASQATVRKVEVSIWRSLWNDLFSQVFRAVRSILNGFVAFFIACNRHRLSIYNHIQEFIQRLLGRTQRSRRDDSRRSRPTVETRNLFEVRRKINLE